MTPAATRAGWRPSSARAAGEARLLLWSHPLAVREVERHAQPAAGKRILDAAILLDLLRVEPVAFGAVGRLEGRALRLVHRCKLCCPR